MDQPLNGRTIAILVANGFEEMEMTEPQRALLGAGATPKIVSPEQALVNGWLGRAWGHYFPIDVSLSSALAADFDGLIIPGGKRSADKLLTLAHSKRFIRGFADGGKPIVAIGHALTLLADAERLSGRQVAADETVTAAIGEADATVSEEALVVDRNLLSAKDDVDMEALKPAVVKLITEVTESLDAAA